MSEEELQEKEEEEEELKKKNKGFARRRDVRECTRMYANVHE